MKNLVKSTII